MNRAKAVVELHRRCAIYTAPELASKLLDIVGWTETADLRSKRLLEPCVGEGAIFVEAARRLIVSLTRYRASLTKATLKQGLRGFEIHPETLRTAQLRVRRLLVSMGIHSATARSLAEHWLLEKDFLLTPIEIASHVAANPPYVRWPKIPGPLAYAYRSGLGPTVAVGDLSIPFLFQMLRWTGGTGSVSALVNDRWMYTQYGEGFRNHLSSHGWSVEVIEERPPNAFVRKVGAYPSVVQLKRKSAKSEARAPARGSRESLRRAHSDLVERWGNLTDAGCTVRVGPALGCGNLFIADPKAGQAVEPELLRPYIAPADLSDTCSRTNIRFAILPFDQAGNLINLDQYPKFRAWARKNKQQLQSRAFIRPGVEWWRTIDNVGSVWGKSPKLLIPELARIPRAAIDHTLSIPAHSIYAVWSADWPVAALQTILNSGLLALTAAALAPQVGSGWYRFYKRYITQVPLPRWSALSPEQREAFVGSPATEQFSFFFEETFGFPPAQLRTLQVG